MNHINANAENANAENANAENANAEYPKLMIDKNGIHILKKSNIIEVKYSVTNNALYLTDILNFDFVKLMYDLNQDLFCKVNLEKKNEENAIITILIKHFFEDLGVPQKYSHMHITKLTTENSIQFISIPLNNARPDNIPLDAEFVPIKSINSICIIENPNKINVEIQINIKSQGSQGLPVFLEKFVATILYKIINRTKLFIENYRVTTYGANDLFKSSYI
jgi:hypothetical protein